MTNLFKTLSDAEMDELDRFLLDRIDEDADTEGRDEGVLDISGLDGLLTAVVSGPVSIQPSQWLPAVWGDFEPEWKSDKEFEHILSLMIRHMNGIAATLLEQPGDFEPIFLEREVEGNTYTVVDEWCEGYAQGVRLEAKQWEEGGQEVSIMIMPILAFTAAMDWHGYNFTGNEIENLQNAITQNVREIYAFWAARRSNELSASKTVRRQQPRVGRNDPCPCGSGKKYKKCCLVSGMH